LIETINPPVTRPRAADTPLRFILRDATQEIHQRLHLHGGFAAIQSGTIGLAGYRDLIVRLYGFYVPFEAAAFAAHERSTWLAQDLAALGVARPLHSLPMCPYIPRLETAQRRLGAAYMAEGSALGGRSLARGLDHLFVSGSQDGRRFFAGHGAATGAAWSSYLSRLSSTHEDLAGRADIVNAALEAFAAFENWLAGWSTIVNV